MKLAIAYLRCSDPRQDKSVEDQRAVIERHAADNNVRVMRWFSDKGYSGKRSDRPAFRRMVKYAASGKAREDGVEIVYVWKINRLGRKRLATLEAFKALEKEGGLVVESLTETTPTDLKTRKVLRTMTALMDELYSDNLGEDAKRGMRERAREGRWTYGLPPFGYGVVYEEIGRSGRLAVTEDSRTDAETVRLAFQLYLAGDGCKRIAARFAREGRVPPSRPGKKKRIEGHWRANHILRIIENPVYKGTIINQGEVICEDAHEPIVDAETWETAQKIRAARRRSRSKTSKLNLGEKGLFAPWLRCSWCGGPMTINRGGSKTSKWKYYYVCATRMENRESCPGLNVRADKLDPLLFQAIEDDVLTPDVLRRLIRETIEAATGTAEAEARRVRADLQKRLKDVEERMQHLYATLRLDELKIVTPRLREERDALRAGLAALPEPEPVPSPEDVDPAAFRQAIIETWKSKEVPEQRRALDRLIDRIVLHPGEARLYYAWKAAPGS